MHTELAAFVFATLSLWLLYYSLLVCFRTTLEQLDRFGLLTLLCQLSIGRANFNRRMYARTLCS